MRNLGKMFISLMAATAISGCSGGDTKSKDSMESTLLEGQKAEAAEGAANQPSPRQRKAPDTP